MKETYITSDQHFYHKNILKFQAESGSRPFDSVEEMNERLIERHNSLVKPHDDVWYLGDFAFTNVNNIMKILARLNGNKHFIFGNHDKPMKSQQVMDYFDWMGYYKEIKIDKKHICLFHFPIQSWNREMHGSYHLYGHTHNSIPYVHEGFSKDIGCDANECYPFNIRDVLSEFAYHAIHTNEKGRDGRNRGAVR